MQTDGQTDKQTWTDRDKEIQVTSSSGMGCRYVSRRMKRRRGRQFYMHVLCTALQHRNEKDEK